MDGLPYARSSKSYIEDLLDSPSRSLEKIPMELLSIRE